MQKKRLRVVTVKYLPLKAEERVAVHTPAFAVRTFAKLIGDSDREHFAVMHLDSQNNALSCEVVSTGTLNGSLVSPREVFKAAFLVNAAGIILAHNHPSGDPKPSKEDAAVSLRLRSSAEILGIRVLDFLILGADGSYWAESQSEK